MINDKRIVKYTPIVGTALIQFGTVSQMLRMVQEGSANDQSLTGWVVVWCAILLYCNWYRVFTPDQPTAMWSTVVSLVITGLAVGMIVWYRLS